MTRLLFAATLLIAAVLAAPGARAQRVSTVDGSKLLSLCSSRNAGLCDAYISGVADSATEVDEMPELSGRKLGICIPKEVKGTALREAVVSSLRAHPEDSGRSAIELTLRALKAAYPCDKTG